MSAGIRDRRNGKVLEGRGVLTGLVAVIVTFGAFTHMSSVWLDEATSIALARLPFGHLWSILSEREANMGVYYVLLKGWTYIGDSLTALRVLSLVLAVAALVVFWRLARLLFDRTTALVAVAFLGVNGMFVAFETEVRGYMLVLVMVLATSYLFVRAVQQPSRWRYVAYAVVAGASIYSHLFCIFVLVGHATSLVWLPDARARLRPFGLAFAGAVVIAAPMIAFTVTNGGQIGWIGDTSLRDLAATAVVVSGGLVGARARDALHYGLGGLLLASYAVLVVVALGRLRDRGSGRDWPLLFAGTSLVAPVVVVAAVSMSIQPVFHYRYFVIVLPFAVLLAARGVTRLRGAVGAVTAGVVVIASLVSAGTCIDSCNREDWTRAGNYVSSRADKGDGLFFYAPEVRTAFTYVVGEAGGDELPVAYPALPWEAPDYAGAAARPDEAFVDGVARRYDRVWLVLSHDDIEGDTNGERVQAWLGRRMDLVDETSYESIRVLLFSSTGV